MKKSYQWLLADLIRPFQGKVSLNSAGEIEIDCTSSTSFQWKGKALNWESYLAPTVRAHTCFKQSGSRLTVAQETKSKDFQKAYWALHARLEDVAKENLNHLGLWGHLSGKTTPTGFVEAEPTESATLLSELYQDNFIVKEKKAFVVDWHRSRGSYLVSIGQPAKSFVDGSAQIASLALGFNDPRTSSMFLRPEILDDKTAASDWDVKEAFKNLLVEQSGLLHVYWVNSGAEAIEVCLRGCSETYPNRKRVIAFEGSFHGRTVLSLHATYNIDKRKPFEIYPGMIEFLPFPEQKNITEVAKEPDGWLKAWSNPATAQAQFDAWKNSSDALLASDVTCLLRVKEEIEKDAPIAVLLEPMQCEGGDRYATNRFFRALRLLTRALDTPMVFDEVQTGLGLGGKFFWHQRFELVDAHGKKDFPDAVAMAKKTQVGVCVSRFNMQVPVEVSAGSMLRGYIQAKMFFDTDFASVEKEIAGQLQRLKKVLGAELIQNPRNCGLAFAFEVPTPDLLNKLITKRFVNGTLFYPAGDRAARFRVMAGVTEREIVHIFRAIYGCFYALFQDKIIGGIPTLEEWAKELPEHQRLIAMEQGQYEEKTPWQELPLPKTEKEYLAIKNESWNEWFKDLVKYLPVLLALPINKDFPATSLAKLKPADLWKRYETDEHFSLLDLMWISSRAFGTRIERWSSEEIIKSSQAVDVLQAALYEEARRDDAEDFAKWNNHSGGIFLAAIANNGELLGVSCAGKLKNFSDVALVSSDPARTNENAYYSADVSVHPKAQGQGLGLRLKVEQLLAIREQGGNLIRSRNRFPEATTMSRLNKMLSSAHIKTNPNDYDGKAMAHYQSITLSKSDPRFAVLSPLSGGVRNKTSLANFISCAYASSIFAIREILPKELQHLYLASGKAEAIDKAFKLLRFKKASGTFALSIAGDSFGATTAVSRTLGGTDAKPFFDWPHIQYDEKASVEENLKKADQALSGVSLEQCLGVFLEPIRRTSKVKKPKEYLKGLITKAHEKGLPVIFHETESQFFQYDSKQLFAAHEDCMPDILVFYPLGQLGVVGTKAEYFLEKPLMMISTWDGDEFSLNLFREKIYASSAL